MEKALPLLVAACALSLTLSAGAILWCTLFSSPAYFKKYVSLLESKVRELVLQFKDLESRWVREKASLSALEESIEGTLESVERKRRQISGAASRLAQPAEDQLPKDRGELVQMLRAKVYGNTG